MKRWLFTLALLGLACLAAVRVLRREHLNRWEIHNLPVEDGPLVCFGDSLVEGVGASAASETFPAQLARRLGRQVVSHGVSGMTTADGLRALREERLEAAAMVIVTLGGNDILQRTPLAETRTALDELFRELQSYGCVVAYTEVLGAVAGERARMHRDLCRRRGVILLPDIMQGILRRNELLSDPVHPNDEGYRLLAERVATVLAPYLSESP